MASALSARLAKLEVAMVPRGRWFIVLTYTDDPDATAQLAHLRSLYGELTDSDTVIHTNEFIPPDPGRPLDLDAYRAPKWAWGAMNAAATAEQATSDADRQQLNQGVSMTVCSKWLNEIAQLALAGPLRHYRPVTIKLLPWAFGLGIASAVVWSITA